MHIRHFSACCIIAFSVSHMFSQDSTSSNAIVRYRENLKKLENDVTNYKNQIKPHLEKYKKLDLRNRDESLHIYKHFCQEKNAYARQVKSLLKLANTCNTDKDAVYQRHVKPIFEENPSIPKECAPFATKQQNDFRSKTHFFESAYRDFKACDDVTRAYEQACQTYSTTHALRYIADTLIQNMYADIDKHINPTCTATSNENIATLLSQSHKPTPTDTTPFAYCGWFAHEDIIHKVLTHDNPCFRDICKKQLNHMYAYRDLLQKLQQITCIKNRGDLSQNDLDAYYDAAERLYTIYTDASHFLESKLRSCNHMAHDIFSTDMTSTYYTPVHEVCNSDKVSNNTHQKINAAIKASNASVCALDKAYKLSHVIYADIPTSYIHTLSKHFHLFNHHQQNENALHNLLQKQKDALNELIEKLRTQL